MELLGMRSRTEEDDCCIREPFSNNTFLDLSNSACSPEGDYPETIRPGIETNAYNDYYDDTIVRKKIPLSVYDAHGTYNDTTTNGQLGSFDDHSFCSKSCSPFDAGSTVKRALPDLPPEASTLGLKYKDSKNERIQRISDDNANCLKYYREEPTRRESLMRALKASRNEKADAKSSNHGCQVKYFVWFLLGLLLTAVYVAISYYIAKLVGSEQCYAGTVANKSNLEVKTILYGEAEFSQFDGNWSANIFKTEFPKKVNQAVEETVLSFYLQDTAVLGFTRPVTNSTICRFSMNLRLDQTLQRGMETFARYVLEPVIAEFSQTNATLRCLVITMKVDAATYVCN